MNHFRIDYRLVHANTLDYWCRPLLIEKLIVVDPVMYQDTLKQLMVKMQCPPDLQIEFASPFEPKLERQRHGLYLFGSIEALLTCPIELEPGDFLSVGSFKPDVQTVLHYQQVALTKQHSELLIDLLDQGVRVTFDRIWSEQMTMIDGFTLKDAYSKHWP